MRILVTGCTGFAGSHLLDALSEQGRGSLFGISRRGQASAPVQEQVTVLACDLGNRSAVEAMLRQVQPDQIYHLAGYAHVGRSFWEADAAWTANLTASRNLYEAILQWGGRPRIVHVSSGLIYGEPASADQLMDEECLLRPVSPYAASKAAADLAAYQYSCANGLEIIRVRAFNHIGPRQAPEFAVSHFAQQLAAIERGKQEPLLVTGDLRPCRDLTDVRDMVRAYVLLMEQGERGEAYNIGTGRAYAMQEVLDRLLALARVKVEVRQEANLLRTRDTAALRADASKLRRTTGWEPHYALDQTLTDILNYWRLVV